MTDLGADMDNERTVPDKSSIVTMDSNENDKEKGSSILTMDPYIPKPTRRPTKRVAITNKFSTRFDELFGPSKWTKYFELDYNKDSDLELFSYISKKVGEGLTFRRTPEGGRILEAKDAEQSELISELINQDDPNIKIQKSQTLNVTHGTIAIPPNISHGNKDFKDCHDDIKENLECQGIKVKHVNTYVRPPRGRRTTPLRMARVCFDSRVLPETVIIGGQRLSVREYFPAPTLCGKCWRFGHPLKFCKDDNITCPLCGNENHSKENCSGIVSCRNCKGSHPAYSRACPRFQMEQLISKTKFKEGLTYKDAKKILQQEGLLPRITYAQTVRKNNNPSSTSTPNNNDKSKTFKSTPSDNVASANINNRFKALNDEQDTEHVHSLPEMNDLVTPVSKRPRQNSSDDSLDLSRGKRNPNMNKGNEEVSELLITPVTKTSSPEEGHVISHINADIHNDGIDDTTLVDMEETLIYDKTQEQKPDEKKSNTTENEELLPEATSLQSDVGLNVTLNTEENCPVLNTKEKCPVLNTEESCQDDSKTHPAMSKTGTIPKKSDQRNPVVKKSTGTSHKPKSLVRDYAMPPGYTKTNKPKRKFRKQ